MIHYVKCWPEPFESASVGIKTHETRRQDRAVPYRVGDTLVLREFEPALGPDPDFDGGSVAGEYTGRELVRRVTYITHGGKFGLPAGLVVMSIREEK